MNIFIFLVLLFINGIYGHGFDAKIKVNCADGLRSVEHIYRTLHKQKLLVSSFDAKFDQLHVNDIVHVGMSKSNCFVRISFDTNADNDILCTPSQKLFSVDQQCFVPACQLKVGNQLLSLYKNHVTISSIELIKKPLKVYALEVQNDHAYFVGNYALLVHNTALPMLLSLHTFVMPSLATGASVGACFGPLPLVTGIVCGGVIGLVIKCFSDKARSCYRLYFDIDAVDRQLNQSAQCNDADNNKDVVDAQAPGKPTESDGFIPKKKWDGKKIKNPNGPGYGWPDKKGNVWIPTGPKGHGGPHWDVEKPNGDYENVVPGGRLRGQK